jgi:hypothetical protein
MEVFFLQLQFIMINSLHPFVFSFNKWVKPICLFPHKTTFNLDIIFWALIWVLKNKKPTIGVGFSGVFVHYSDEISDRDLIIDFAKVIYL